MTCACGATPAGTVERPTTDDLANIGAAVLNLASATVTLGHASPAETNDYGTRDELTVPALVVSDLVAWSTRRGDWREAACRLRHYVTASGWSAEHLAHIEAVLLPHPVT